MNALNWFTDFFSKRGKALSLYRRGMAKAKKQDQRGAIDDYTAVIDMPDAPANVKAMVLYNRALAYMASGDFGKGGDDLDAVLAMDEAPANVKRSARQKLVRRQSRSSKGRA